MIEPDVRAGGGVVLRRRSGVLEVLLVHRSRYDDLTLPKGKASHAEDDSDAPRREVWEETGLRCAMGSELPSIAYADADGRSKRVRYWLMSPIEDGPFRPGPEVDLAPWVPVEEARSTLTYDRDRPVLRAAIELAEPLYLVRHAKAGSRAHWTGDDRVRPLTGKGMRQAEGLVDRLEGRRVARILSSPTARCVDTVAPLASVRGLEVETVAWLIEDTPTLRVLEELASLGGPAVLSSHGDLIPPVVCALADGGVPVDGPRSWKKGSTWILERAAGFPSALRYLAPPRDRAG